MRPYRAPHKALLIEVNIILFLVPVVNDAGPLRPVHEFLVSDDSGIFTKIELFSAASGRKSDGPRERRSLSEWKTVAGLGIIGLGG
jgi:hypothetical protein